MKIILIGEKNSRRTEYFVKAAGQPGVFVCVQELEEVSTDMISDKKIEDTWIKIDPCSYKSSHIEKMNGYLKVYQKFLEELPKDSGYHYLNAPEAILEVLDKRKCKNKLIAYQVPTTPLLAERIQTLEQLHDIMREKRVSSVFIKPVFGSGAAGIAAYRWNWQRNQGVLYTSCKKTEGVFQNTKKIHHITDWNDIEETLKVLFALDVIVEQWIPKAQYQGKSYDLRVVYQFGKIDYIVARQSGAPMTNLHLNNQALDYKKLQLSVKLLEEIQEICHRAMAAFPGLFYAGIDILLEKKTKKPYIIEINGQGDCVYQDMHGENKIYQEQIRYMLDNLDNRN